MIVIARRGMYIVCVPFLVKIVSCMSFGDCLSLFTEGHSMCMCQWMELSLNWYESM